MSLGYNTLGIARKSKTFKGSTPVAPKRVLVYGDNPGEVKLPYNVAVAEVLSLTVTTDPSVDGSVTVTLNGTGVPVPVLATDDINGAATKIRNATYAGWTTSGSGANVLFTATTAGAKTGTNSFGPGGTGTAATLTTTVEGEDIGGNAGELAGVSFDKAADGEGVALSEHGYVEIEIASAVPYKSRVNTADALGRIKAVNEPTGAVVYLVGVAEEAGSVAGDKIMVNCRRFGQKITV